MSKRKYSSRDDDDDDSEMNLVKRLNKLSYEEPDDGYETDATVIDEAYDPEIEREFYMANSPVRAPRTPPPMMYGPIPATELLDRNGEPLYFQPSDSSNPIPYTSNHLRQQYPATNTFGRFEDLSKYTLNEPNDNVGGSLRRSRTGRKTIKRKNKRRLLSRKRKSFRRKDASKRKRSKHTTKSRRKTHRKMRH